jgi:ribosome-associated heat shock protein Hsp15
LVKERISVYALNMRIDKWLWTARFFKTRSLASEAAETGKVTVNGDRAKPAKLVRPGDEIKLRKPPYEYSLVVKGVSDRRGPAKEAQLLYVETPESLETRAKLSAELKQMPPPLFPGRPTKKNRRDLEKFQAQYGEDE